MKHRGFTLLELLLVILITGILAVVVAPIIQEPIRAYFDQTTRAELVDSAEMALRRMARDARRSLPYSVRVNGAQTALEFVSVADVARYRTNGGNPASRLSFNTTDGSFNILGLFSNFGSGTLAGDQRLAIFNLGAGSAGFNIYNGDAVATPASTVVDIDVDPTPQNPAIASSEHKVTLNPAFQFQASSPSHRVYITNGAVSYACFNGGLFRDTGYGYLATQPGPAAVAGGTLLTDNVTACQFDYDPGNSGRPGLLMMSLTLTRGGESITLLHQVHIHNAT
ncbi:MAG: prepilin-type N-terminal cleavage/methylation domain-containing protein [Proteobacteria bacterium]|nr:prepilin-type N-terminal cleavage/methylation domain-containing protein [Pseudomonadota bacterium]